MAITSEGNRKFWTRIVIPCAGLAAILSLLAVQNRSGSDKLRSKVVNEFTTSDSVRVEEIKYWTEGKSDTSRQVDLYYPNGAQVRAVDAYNDGVFDDIYVPKRPANVKIVELKSGWELMALPDSSKIKQYLSVK